jgi:hypothetical protein
MTMIEKIIKFYDNKIRMKLVWFSLVMSLTLVLWKGVDDILIFIIISCIMYIILEWKI